MRTCLTFLATVLFLLGCGTSQEDLFDRLEDPSLESIEKTTEYPAVVKVILPLGRGLCTGTFIGERVVLTAAHCTQRRGTYRIYTTFGKFRTRNIIRLGPGVVGDPSDIALMLLDRDVASVDKGQVLSVSGSIKELDRVRLVGYGCNNLEKKTGASVKRTGTNQVYRVRDHIELVTPLTRSILGPKNRAGACFGDSGGPLLRRFKGNWQVAGVSHAGEWDQSYTISKYSNLNSTDNLNFLYEVDREHELNLFRCQSGGAFADLTCGLKPATLQVFSFLKMIWSKLLSFF